LIVRAAPVMPPRLARLIGGALLGAVLLGGCTYSFDKSGPEAGQGTLVINAPGIIPLSELEGATDAPGSIPQSGRFAGTGRSLNNPGARCGATIRVSEWFVNGNQVRFGGFRGTISPDGELAMQLRATRIIGRFVNSEFQGQTWSPPPGCNYELTLRPVG
jgi:hypothetical protein